jgi:hypothetical protein
MKGQNLSLKIGAGASVVLGAANMAIGGAALSFLATRKQARKCGLLDSIFFWTRNDYLIMSALMRKKMNEVWSGARVANADYKAVLGEFRNGIRTPNPEPQARYQARVWQNLNTGSIPARCEKRGRRGPAAAVRFNNHGH